MLGVAMAGILLPWTGWELLDGAEGEALDEFVLGGEAGDEDG
jgi:hypothetical protein